LLSETWGR